MYEKKTFVNLSWLSEIGWWSFAAMIFQFLFWRNRSMALMDYASVAQTYLLWKSFFFHAARPGYTDTVFLNPLKRTFTSKRSPRINNVRRSIEGATRSKDVPGRSSCKN